MEQGLLTAILVLAVYYDSMRNRIPNLLCGAGMAAGVLYFVCFCGMKVCMEHCIWAAIWLLLFFLLWRWKALGGGDVKLIVTAGLLLGENSIQFLMCAGICVGIHAFVLMAVRGNYMKRMTVLAQYVIECLQQKRWTPYPFDRETEYAEGGIRMSYGMLAGHLIAVFLRLYH